MPTENLRVALVPIDIKLGDVRHNVAWACECINNLEEGIDLVVLPELFNVGFGDYSVSPEHLAEPDDGSTVSSMLELSRIKNVAIVGGFLATDGKNLYNRAFAVYAGKTLAFYNKRHLFAGPESRIFRPGQEESPIVDVKGWKLRIAICYDLRFPVWNRAVDNNYDALIIVANWPNSRYYAWSHLIKARAIENQAYVAACNREGKDVYGTYMRHDSMVVNAMGYDVSEPADGANVYATFDASRLNDDRKFLQPWRVADKFQLIL